MAGLLEKPTTDVPGAAAPPPEASAPDAPAPEAPLRACATCSAPLAEGQDWCLECGAAQPGRLGGRPGWRAALTVLAVTLVLVGGAGAAAYAALSTEAQRDATAAAPPQAAPTVEAPPVVQAPTPTQAEETPQVEAPKSEPADVPAPSDSGDDDTAATPSTPSTPSPSAGATAGGGTTGGGTSAGEEAAADPVAVELPAKAAKLYDPFGRAAESGSKPANAIDGKEKTALELPVDPADGTVNAGLTLSLAKATTLSDLKFQADTPGFTVEVYATKDAEIPPDVLDARWEHVGDRSDVGVEETVALDGRFRHVLLWVTEQPADTKVAIPEVQLFD